MNFPLQIQFRDMEESDFISNAIWDHAEKLRQFNDRITYCHVIVSSPHHHRRKGKIYHVQIRLNIPGGDIFVTTEPEKDGAHEDVYVTLRDAFDAVKRRMEDSIRRRRGNVKERQIGSHAKVLRILREDDCGFIGTPEGREIYFHKNSVLNNGWNELKVGDEVRFSEEMGEKGPQVTSMEKVGRSGHLNVRI